MRVTNYQLSPQTNASLIIEFHHPILNGRVIKNCDERNPQPYKSETQCIKLEQVFQAFLVIIIIYT